MNDIAAHDFRERLMRISTLLAKINKHMEIIKENMNEKCNVVYLSERRNK